jgi:hypothetical protein
MENFYPFIYQPKKKKEEPLSLYIELESPPFPQEKEEKKESEECGIIVIELI